MTLTATDWEAVVAEAMQREEWALADQARLRWASCLHRQGRCDDAMAVLRQAWDGICVGGRIGVVMAAMLCIRLLRRCDRENEAGELWLAVQDCASTAMRRTALNLLLSPESSELHEIGDRTHGRICAHRRQAGT